MSTETSNAHELIMEDRARWLGELAYAGGDVDLQHGWADYVKSEREKIEKIHPPCRAVAFARFKELSA